MYTSKLVVTLSMEEDQENTEPTSPTTPSSSSMVFDSLKPMRTIAAMATNRNLADDQRFRSDSEPIMAASSINSLNSSLTSDRDSVISTSSTSSEANLFQPHYLRDGPHKGLILARTSSTKSAPSDTLIRGLGLPGEHDSDGYCGSDVDPEDCVHDDGRMQDDRGMQEEEEDQDLEANEDEELDEFPDDDMLRTLNPHQARQATITRKSAIRRVHTVTPKASPKVKSRRPRAISRNIEAATNRFVQEAGNGENFTITVDLAGCKEVVVYPARSGVKLKDCIAEIAESRNFSASGVHVFIESSDSPTPLECECSLFAERQLFVREIKEEDCEQKEDECEGRLDSAFTSGIKEFLLSNKSFRPRAKPVTLDRHRSVSTSVVPQIHVNDDYSNYPPRGGGKKDLSKFLGVETDKQGRTRRPSLPAVNQLPAAKKVVKMDPKLQVLQDKLDYYMIHGLPDFPSLIFAYPQREDDAELLSLEENWRSVVNNHTELPKSVIDQQEAIWEIIHTEVNYIKNIRIIIDIYLTCLIDLQAAGILNSIQAEKIFSNITDIEIRHSKFWKGKLIQVMKVTRASHQPLSAAEVAKAFEGFGEHFQPYVKFCAEEGSCMEFLREKQEEDDQLKLFLQWCRDHSLNNKHLKLGDLLVYPMQRITKYPLLLKAVGKKTQDEEEKQVILRELENVKTFCNRVNHEVTREQETKKMKKMIERIELYDWPEIPPAGAGSEEVKKLIEANPIKLDLHFPMKGACASQPRWVVHEGSVKIRDQYEKSRFEVTIVIFTDMLTICKKGKTKENSLRICRPPIRIDRVKTAELKDGSGFVILYSDEYNCACNWYVITTSKPSDWLNKINKAKEMYDNVCNNKDMDKFLDTSQSYLRLPDFLREPREKSSPRSSPTNSPRMPRQFTPGNTSPSLAECSLNEVEGVCDMNRKDGDSINEGDSFDKDSNVESSSEDDSPDADEEASDEEQTPTLTRPSDLFDEKGQALSNGRRLPRQDKLTYNPEDFNFSGTNGDQKPVPILNFDDEESMSPTSPTCDPNAVNIMQFDSDLEEEDPLKPTPFCVGMTDPSISTPKRTTQNTLKGTVGKLFSRPKSRKPIPNGLMKTREQMQQEIPASSSDGDESGGDLEVKKGKKNSKSNRIFSKKNGKS